MYITCMHVFATMEVKFSTLYSYCSKIVYVALYQCLFSLQHNLFSGISAGHYTAYAKHPISSEWHCFNDETVSHQKPQEEDYSNAYILFYHKQGMAYFPTSVECSFLCILVATLFLYECCRCSFP